MVTAICLVLYHVVFPNLLFYGGCRCAAKQYRWYRGLLFTVFFCGIACLETTGQWPSAVLLSLRLLALPVCMAQWNKQDLTQSLQISAFVISIYYLTNGMTQSISFWVAGELPAQSHLIAYLDIARHLASIVLLAVTYHAMFHCFSSRILRSLHTAPLLLVLPLLFISLAEQTVSAAIYGYTLVWDSSLGMIFPVVHHMEFLLLHLLAYLGMWSILLAFQRLILSMQQQQTIQLLELQTQAQETYVREAKARYEQTRSFRHDIKNHFVVLKELLSRGELQRATAYLAPLGETVDSLSVPVHSNNTVVDVLLGSKWMAAQQHGIETECALKIPASSPIRDMDWCILLANAVDNAISANQSLSIPRRYLRICGREKGNLFLLHLENSCAPSAPPPVYGVGLNNIAAVVEKYHGQMDLESADGRFQLDILLVLSQQ